MTKDELRARIKDVEAERDAARAELEVAANRLQELGQTIVTLTAERDDARDQAGRYEGELRARD